MFKKEKGITLVALVVTIVILLILAGVTITMTLSQNGLFTRAQQGKNAYKAGEEKDAARMDSYLNVMNDVLANRTTSGN